MRSSVDSQSGPKAAAFVLSQLPGAVIGNPPPSLLL